MAINPWIQFIQRNKGSGKTLKALSKQYKLENPTKRRRLTHGYRSGTRSDCLTDAIRNNYNHQLCDRCNTYDKCFQYKTTDYMFCGPCYCIVMKNLTGEYDVLP